MSKKRNRAEEEGGSNKGKGKQKDTVIKKISNYKNNFPPVGYTLSKEEKRAFCECLYGIKVLFGYSSNMKRFVTLNGDLMLESMKSHDCHVMI